MPNARLVAILSAAAVLASHGCRLPVAPAGPSASTGVAAGVWTRVDSGLTDALVDMQFLDQRTGFIVGEAGTVLRTTDGAVWQTLKPATLAGKKPGSISMIDAATGFLVTDKSLFRTADGGQSWSVVTEFAEKYRNEPERVRFADALNGWVLASGGLWRTSDGGVSWTQSGAARESHGDPGGADLRLVAGQAWYWSSGKLYKFFEGVGWGTVADPPTGAATGTCANCSATAAFVSPTDIWFAGGPNGQLYHTLDGGSVWTSVPLVDRSGELVLPAGFFSGGGLISFADANNGWVVAGNGAAQTEDGGKTWAMYVAQPRADERGPSRQPVSFGGALALQMLTPRSGWLAGRNGLLASFTRP